MHYLIKNNCVMCDVLNKDDELIYRGLGIKLLKKALGPGERWVTAHPNGEGTKGIPILIREHSDGTASVIGGAGGKLNHLKLRGIKSESDYKATLGEKAQANKLKKKAKVEADKKAGIYQSKVEQNKKISEKVRKEQQDFVKTVAEIAGWDKKDLEFDEEAHAGLSDKALEKARKKHESDLYKRAMETVEVNRQALLKDADKQAEAGLGEIPLKATDETDLDVQDLAPVKEQDPNKLGFNPDYANRAGMDEETVKKEAKEAEGKEYNPPTPEQIQAKEEKKAQHEQINQEVQNFIENNPDTQKKPTAKILDDAKKTAELLKAQKRLKLVQKKAKEARKELEGATTVEDKAYILDVSDEEVDAQTKKQFEDDVRTAGARSFIEAIEKQGGDSAMAGHIGAGSFNALNGASMAIGGEAMIDRSVVDVLGVAGASQVLARRIMSGMKPEDVDKVRLAVELYHVQHSDELQKTALADAQKLFDSAKAIELPEASNGLDLTQAQEANHKRRSAIEEAQRILGNAHGEMMATASLVSALQGNKPDKLEVNMGKITPETAVQQLNAIGIHSGEFKLDKVGDALVCTIDGGAMDNIAKPIDTDAMAKIRKNLDIMEGKYDEDGWLPNGFANRPDLVMDVKEGVAKKLAEPFDPKGKDLNESLRDYIGGRMADGDAPVDILADIQSADFFQKAGDFDKYREALDAVAPLKGVDGKMMPVETLTGAWQKMAEDFVEKKYGTEFSPIHQQNFDVDDTSVEALHRALTKTPEGVLAFKPVGELTQKDRNGLRNWWINNIANNDTDTTAQQNALQEHLNNEPQKEMEDMFGEVSTNPEWSAWNSKKQEMQSQLKASALTWKNYVSMHKSPQSAIESVQDLIKSHVAKGFADTMNRLRPDSPLKIGKTTIRNNLDHLDAVDPEARQERVSKEKALIDSLRERIDGKYASGSVKDKLEAVKKQKEAFEQSQMGFFSTEELEQNEGKTEQSLGKDERYTIGHSAEMKLAGMMSVVGKNFKAGQPVKLWNCSMSGGTANARQRFLKMFEANKRIVGALGTGSGKSALQLAGFTHMHEQGKVKKGLILCPSVVQAQFGGEALRYLQPGKYKWHADPSATREQRISAMKDPETHMVVATHQSFRDDMLYMGAKQAGIDTKTMAGNVQKMSDEERHEWAKNVLQNEGISLDYLSVDESQYTLNRQGKENSRLSNIVDSVAHHTPYYMLASADPVKNDASEVYDLLKKMDPQRYADRNAFMRKYGNPSLSKDGLKREMARYVYANSITPDVNVDRKQVQVPLNAHQKQALGDLDKQVSEIRMQAMEGKTATDLIKKMCPERFEGVPEEQHEAVAQQLQKHIGLLRNATVKRILDTSDKSAKLDKAVEIAGQRKGKAGVIFAHNLQSVENLRQRLEAQGHRVITLTGADSTEEKDKKRLMFQPEQGDPQADILIASDTGATGLNLQRGQWLVQYDTPQTAMTHAQRNGRIYRTGQKNDVELMDLVADHQFERDARERLSKKYELRELLTSPLEGLDDTGLAWHLKQQFSQDSEQ